MKFFLKTTYQRESLTKLSNAFFKNINFIMEITYRRIANKKRPNEQYPEVWTLIWKHPVYNYYSCLLPSDMLSQHVAQILLLQLALLFPQLLFVARCHRLRVNQVQLWGVEGQLNCVRPLGSTQVVDVRRPHHGTTHSLHPLLCQNLEQCWSLLATTTSYCSI